MLGRAPTLAPGNTVGEWSGPTARAPVPSQRNWLEETQLIVAAKCASTWRSRSSPLAKRRTLVSLFVVMLIGCHDPPRQCAATDLEVCRSQCLNGNARSCQVLATSVDAPGPQRNDALAADMYERACKGGIGAACVRAVRLLDFGINVTDEHARHLDALLDKGCAAGEAASCLKLAKRLMAGNRADKNTRAGPLFDQACRSGIAEGCTGLGLLSVSQADAGLGNPTDLQAIGLIKRGCDGGDLAGCVLLGDLYLDGTAGATPDDNVARELFKKACDSDYLPGCSALGGTYTHGQKEDVHLAGRLFKNACDGGEMPACAALGGLYILGKMEHPGKADDELGVGFLQRACDKNDADGCANLGLIYSSTRLGPSDNEKAAKCYRASCNGGNAHGCTGLGTLYAEGLLGGRANDEEAASLLRKGCDGGDPHGCTGLGLMYGFGKMGDKPDAKKAVELYRKGCDGGDERGCAPLGVAYVQGLVSVVTKKRQ